MNLNCGCRPHWPGFANHCFGGNLCFFCLTSRTQRSCFGAASPQVLYALLGSTISEGHRTIREHPNEGYRDGKDGACESGVKLCQRVVWGLWKGFPQDSGG